jgi:hypothetical protein
MVWAWLRRPGARLPVHGLSLEAPRLPAGSLAATMRAFLAAPWCSSVTWWSLLGSHDTTKLLDKDAHAEDVPTHAQGTRFVAAFAPRSRVRIGDEVEVVVDTERMHLFDPGTGAAIRA